MVKEIVKDIVFLGQKSLPATRDDQQVIEDLKDTLEANKFDCMGLAANMIGVLKRIIIFDNNDVPMIMVNPVIMKKSGSYQTQEGCLSLDGLRGTERFRTVKVQYQDEQFKTRIKTFTGMTAQVIQHEIDHLEGIII